MQQGTSLESRKGLAIVLDIIFLFTISIGLVKIFMSTLTTSDGLGLFIILTVSLAARVVDYEYPKRPDLYLEMKNVEIDLTLMKTRIENLESEMTGVRFGLKNRL